jgi:hypothetical protein
LQNPWGEAKAVFRVSLAETQLGLGCPKQAFAKIATPRMGIDNTFDFIRQFNLFRLVFMALPGKTLSAKIATPRRGYK